MKNIFLNLILLFVKQIAVFFYDRKYLTGRFFENRLGGWYWAMRGIFFQKILGFNRKVPWPTAPFILITNPENVQFHPDDINNFQTFGIYFQNPDAQIVLGHGVYIAPNVGIITTNHDPKNPDKHLPGKDVVLCDKCWVGMNSVILPGVTLGPNTVVGAGSVVTKSFFTGNCIIAGSPAKIIKQL